MRFSAGLAFLSLTLVSADLEVAAACTGSGAPVVTEPRCYKGTKSILGASETVYITIEDFANNAGHMSLTGEGVQKLSCDSREFTKSGQDISVDLNDCVPSSVSVKSVKYCYDQDTIAVSLKYSFISINVDAERVACASMAAPAVPELELAASCTGSASPVVTEPQCYKGTKSILGASETVYITIEDFANNAGHMSLTGEGVQKLSCDSREFTKSGQDISVDLNDCVPSSVTVKSVKYCYDQDTIAVSLKYSFISINVDAERVACASMAAPAVPELELAASCTGSASPVLTEPQCYKGTKSILGASETVYITIEDFANNAGHMSLTGEGVQKLSCDSREFTKSGQDISVDLNDCVPSSVTVKSVKYCYDQDAIAVSLKYSFISINVDAERVACSSMMAQFAMLV